MSTDRDVRPDFAGFAASIRAEARWSAEIHSSDKTGQAATDQRILNELAAKVEQVGKHLGFLGDPPRCHVCEKTRHKGVCRLVDLRGPLTVEGKRVFLQEAGKLVKRIAKAYGGTARTNAAGIAVSGDVYLIDNPRLYVSLSADSWQLGILYRVADSRAEKPAERSEGNLWLPWDELGDPDVLVKKLGSAAGFR